MTLNLDTTNGNKSSSNTKFNNKQFPFINPVYKINSASSLITYKNNFLSNDLNYLNPIKQARNIQENIIDRSIKNSDSQETTLNLSTVLNNLENGFYLR